MLRTSTGIILVTTTGIGFDVSSAALVPITATVPALVYEVDAAPAVTNGVRFNRYTSSPESGAYLDIPVPATPSDIMNIRIEGVVREVDRVWYPAAYAGNTFIRQTATNEFQIKVSKDTGGVIQGAIATTDTYAIGDAFTLIVEGTATSLRIQASKNAGALYDVVNMTGQTGLDYRFPNGINRQTSPLAGGAWDAMLITIDDGVTDYFNESGDLAAWQAKVDALGQGILVDVI